MEYRSSNLAVSSISNDEDSPILVATDGHPQADPAMIAAAFIAGRVSGNVQVFSVVDRATPACIGCKNTSNTHHAIVEGKNLCRTQEKMRGELELRRATIETQVALTVGEAANWPITVCVGPLDQTSHDLVVQSHAQLIVIGQCRQRHVDAPSGACHATNVFMQRAIPVYIASPTLRGIARQAVVAMDFSVTSVQAAHIISRLSAADANMYLVHVLGRAHTHDLDERRHQLQHIERSIRAISDVRVESVLLQGDAVREMLGFADGIQADVIACGISSIPAFPNTQPCPPSIGRVTRELIRQASCSMLIAPHLFDY